MRRKMRTDASSNTAAGLGPDSLVPAPIDDVTMPYPLRKKQHDLWIEKRRDWVARRKEHALQHGWPGGDLARTAEEDATHPIPNAPFDPEWEIAHGGL